MRERRGAEKMPRANDAWAHAAILFAFVFVLYFFTGSRGLDEPDSVQFAMAVRHFDLAKSQPPAPGYPLFVFAGWLAQELFRWGSDLSLHVVSAGGGALFVAMWFLIVRSHFGEAFAWLVAFSLCLTPIVWMTSTHVLSDSLAAGLFSAELWFAVCFQSSGRRRHLCAMSLLGSATAGVMPQMCAVLVLVIITALWQRRAPKKEWAVAFSILLSGCLLWLVPMWFLQARLHPEPAGWRVYPDLVEREWKSCLTNSLFGAGSGLGFSSVEQRFDEHIGGWFTRGLGFAFSTLALVFGSFLALIGVVSTARRRLRTDGIFWKKTWPWALLQTGIVFCFLSPDQRNYLIIFPLLLVGLSLGFFRLPGSWKFFAIIWPACLCCISIPLAVENHREEAPAIRLVGYLKNIYAPAERGRVLLLLRGSIRYFQWYAPGFEISSADNLEQVAPRTVEHSVAIYTDNPNLKLPPGRLLQPIAHFERRGLIGPKQNQIDVFKIGSVDSDIGEQIILKPRPK